MPCARLESSHGLSIPALEQVSVITVSIFRRRPSASSWIDLNFDPNQETDYKQVLDETFPALAELRSQGVIGAIGVGGGPPDQDEVMAQAGADALV